MKFINSLIIFYDIFDLFQIILLTTKQNNILRISFFQKQQFITVSPMSALSINQLLDYMNLARTNPQKFSQYIKVQLDSFIDDRSLPLKEYCTYTTNQGKGVWKQAYQFVKNHKPLPPFKLNQGLNLAAMDHAVDMMQNNFFGHQSSNGMSFSERIERRCGKAYGGCAQNLGMQFNIQGRNHPLQTIMGLIIDDGCLNRGHRNTIFSDKYKYVGIYSVKSGDRFYTCFDYHTEDLPTVQSSGSPLVGENFKPSSNTGNNSKNPQQFGFDKDDFSKKIEQQKGFGNKGFENSNWGDKGWQNNDSSGKVSGQRYVTSKSTSTKTSSVNGKTTKVTTTKLKYSDGSTQEQVSEETY